MFTTSGLSLVKTLEQITEILPYRAGYSEMENRGRAVVRPQPLWFSILPDMNTSENRNCSGTTMTEHAIHKLYNTFLL